MTWYPNKFIRLRKDNKGKVTFGDNMSSKIIGKGTTAMNNKIQDKNALLVEDLKPNLLSVSQTCDQGHICILFWEMWNQKKGLKKTCWDCCKEFK